MRFPTIRGALFLFAASLLLACETAPVKSSIALIDLDKEWVGLYEKRLDAARANSATPADINNQLAQLSVRAEQGGNDAAEGTDSATAAAFYRIAVTAAWTAGPPRNTRVLPLRDKGTAVCARLAADPAAQPRDCALIRVAPELATLEAQTAEVRAIRDAAAPLVSADFNEAERVTNTMTQSIQRVLRERPAPASQAKSFDDYIELNLNRGFCTLPGLMGRVRSHSPPQDQMQRILASANAAQDALKAANVSTACN